MLLREAFAPALEERKIRLGKKLYRWRPKVWQILGILAGACIGLWGLTVLILGIAGGAK